MVRFRPILSAGNLSETQWRVLRVTDERGSIDFSDLAAATVITKSSLSRVVRDLSARGLISRSDDPDDQRQALIGILPAGTRLVESLAPAIEAEYQLIYDAVGLADIQELLSRLEAFIVANGEREQKLLRQ